MDTRALVVLALVGCGDSTAVTVDGAIDTVPAAVVPTGIVGWFDGRCCSDPSGHGYQVWFAGPFDTSAGPGYRGQGYKMDGQVQRGVIDTSTVTTKSAFRNASCCPFASDSGVTTIEQALAAGAAEMAAHTARAVRRRRFMAPNLPAQVDEFAKPDG